MEGVVSDEVSITVITVEAVVKFSLKQKTRKRG